MAERNTIREAEESAERDGRRVALSSAIRAARFRDGVMSLFLLLCLIGGTGIVILAEALGTAAPYEYLWLGTGVLGMVFILWMMRDLITDREVLRADGVNGGDIMLNTTALGTNLLLFAVVSCVTLIGVIAIILPVTPGTDTVSTITPLRVTFTVGLFGIAVFTDFCALWIRFRRSLFRHYLEDKHNARTLAEINQSRT